MFIIQATGDGHTISCDPKCFTQLIDDKNQPLTSKGFRGDKPVVKGSMLRTETDETHARG
jgi:hypothetical protein